jgi:hypothetical protein
MATKTKTTSGPDAEAPDNILANISGQFGLSLIPCGLVLPDSLNEEEWTKVGQQLGRTHQRMQWVIGDWWAFGEARKYGSRKALVESDDWHAPGFSACADAASVCRSFAETSRRREVLSFQHHREVMGLDKKQADKLLDWCEATIAETGKPRSTRQLREEMHRRFAHDPAPTPIHNSAAPFGVTNIIKARRRGPYQDADPYEDADPNDIEDLDPTQNVDDAIAFINEAIEEALIAVGPSHRVHEMLLKALAALDAVRAAVTTKNIA